MSNPTRTLLIEATLGAMHPAGMAADQPAAGAAPTRPGSAPAPATARSPPATA